MQTITWGHPRDRTFESGLDRGVLYPPDAEPVPWNGLISVIEKFNKDRTPIYYDGMKISDEVTVGDFEASMSAVTFPKEFEELESFGELRKGVMFGEQPPQSFGLCYRTLKGDGARGEGSSYKLHILYNLIAIPSDRTYASKSDNPSFVEFEWEISAVPEEVPGFRPTAHIVVDSDDIHPLLLAEIEATLYGSLSAGAVLLPMADLVTFMYEWALVTITDHEDGTWTASTEYEGYITGTSDPDVFTIEHVDAVYLDDDTYVITTTSDELDQLEIRVYDDGTWVAIPDNDAMIHEEDGIFTIQDIEPLLVGEDWFRIESKEKPDS